ncbi:MmgE/PrpD family protein [Defluviimonas sp. WL0002]|uniref:MmgE/PrpD family protein n=1 Tax=Albidovulum marisflavi TaxID=2984159 RepID=A0ABT2ZEV7_9RHOB|nr:MmgE/PrpD family protein [Defluviimonas sp. WL0002]MCV2869629.1 MmgE/PrpD family protein [Defluviimonas sp. WL0002]
MRDEGSQAVLKKVQDFVLGLTPDQIPESAMERAALMLLDTLGICAAASPMEAGLIARRVATQLYSTSDSTTGARMLFDGRTVSLAGAAFAAATQLDNLDGHDGYNPTKGHIGVVALPTLAVLAQHIPGLAGRDALTALIVGYEIAGRAGIALHATVSDYHTSGAWNALGVAAMAARLRGQTPAMLREALGIAEYHGPRSQMMREIATPTMLHDGSGWGALAGMTAAILAEEGFTGAPAVTVEAQEVAPCWDDLGRFWQIEHQYVKPYPICRWAHAAIDAARELKLAHGFTHEDIEGLTIRSFNYAVELFPGVPDTTSKAQYALPFPVAVMLVHGEIGLQHISGPGLADPEVARLVGLTRLEATPRHEVRYPGGRWADVEIRLKDGRVLQSVDTHARGGPERPFERQAVLDKFMAFAVPALGFARAEAIRDATLALTGPGSRFDRLGSLIVDPL